MKKIILYLLLTFLWMSCVKKDYKIQLKWNKAYPEDTFEKNITGLKWCLSYLGSPIASDKLQKGIVYLDTIIQLDVKQLGFTKNAANYLSTLHSKLKQSEEYKKNNAIDIGRYIALTLGSSNHYYKIVDIPETIQQFDSTYNFYPIKGYISNSSVSKVHRIISYSKKEENYKRRFLSAEIDSVTKKILEYESLEIMPNGQLKFGVYNPEGNLIDAAEDHVTNAGKPAKCIWCHEVSILPIFTEQINFKEYLPYLQLDDSLVTYNKNLQKYQNDLWKDIQFKNKKNHQLMELVYIAFMEPSAERLSKEWNLPLTTVKEKLKHLKTHQHHEFPFLGVLYHRKEIDRIAPFISIEVPESIREKSSNEINLLK